MTHQNEKAKMLIEFDSTTGSGQSIILVTDEDKDPSDIEYQRLEFCSFDSDNERWKTEQRLGFIDKITGFGIPEDIVD